MGNAIIVAGHAIPRDTADLFSDSSWFLLDFQRNEASSYVGHVRRGVELAAADPDSLLIFTGGQSRAEAGAQSEAAGYWGVAEHLDWFGHVDVRTRAITEDFARDSFENLLLGLCRFKEYSCSYPRHVSLVSWEFKRERFHLHREAIRWPASRFTYVGPNNPPDLPRALASESQARERYTRDPYSAGPFFQSKREQRNPFRRRHPYSQSCPELVSLFEYQGPQLFSGPLPWD